MSKSSTEAEYRALSFTTAEVDWLKQLLAFMHISLPHVPVLFCDNLSTIPLSFNYVQHCRTSATSRRSSTHKKCNMGDIYLVNVGRQGIRCLLAVKNGVGVAT